MVDKLFMLNARWPPSVQRRIHSPDLQQMLVMPLEAEEPLAAESSGQALVVPKIVAGGAGEG